MRNTRYGKGLSNDKFDWATWKTAAQLCDQTVTYTNGSTSPAFTADAVIDTANSLMVNCKIILAGFRGIMPYQGGKYYMKIEHGGDDSDIAATPSDPTTAFTATADHIIGGIQLDGESKQHKCNRCVVTYVDPEADYQPNDVTFPTEGSADDVAFLAADNGIRLEKRVTLPTIANRKIAEQYAQVFVKRSRTQKFIAFVTNLATSNTTVGDLVRVQSTSLGLDGIFRIMDLRINADGLVELSGMEHQASTYAIGATGDDYIRPALSLPNPLQVSAPTGLTLASGAEHNLVDANNNTTYRIRTDWTASADPFVTDYVVQFKKSSDADYVTFTQTAETYTYISPVALGEKYDVRVLARNELNRRSAYVTSQQHEVVNTYTPASGASSSVSGGKITTITQNWTP
jgi:predicted phage tail protein